MKMTKIAVAAIGLCAGAAFAQEWSGKVYGLMDGGLASASNQTATPANSSPMKFITSGDSTSIFGYAGSRKLANGVTVGVDYQAGVNINNGTNGGAANNFFNRQANFSFAGDFGKLALGLQFDPAFLAMAATDPRGISNNNSALAPWINSSALTQGGNNNSAVNIFNNNSIQYSKGFGGLSATLAYGVGNSANGSSYNNITSLGLVWAGGAWVVSGGLIQNAASSATTLSSSSTNIGVAYTMGQWRLATNMMDFKNSDSTAQYTTNGLGATYTMSGPWSFNAAYYVTKDKPNGGQLTNTTVGLNYAMDKSVAIYAQLGMQKMDATGFGAAGASTAAWGIDAGGGSGFAGSAGNTVQTIYVGTKVSF